MDRISQHIGMDGHDLCITKKDLFSFHFIKRVLIGDEKLGLGDQGCQPLAMLLLGRESSR